MTLLEKLRKLVLDGMCTETAQAMTQAERDEHIDEIIDGWSNVELLRQIGYLDE